MKLINDTSMAVSVACYDCDEPLHHYSLAELADRDTPPRCSVHGRIERLHARRLDLAAVLNTPTAAQLDDTIQLFARSLMELVTGQLEAARAAARATGEAG